MNTVRLAAALSLISLSIGVAIAQPGSGPGPGPGPMASAPGKGMGPGGGRSPRWGADYTPGWRMMSEAERTEHRERMQSMKSYDECKTYQQQHHEKMAERAKERAAKALSQPRRDACARLKP